MISRRRLDVLRAADEGRLLYRPDPEAWAVDGENVSTSARAATRAGLLADPPGFFGLVGLTEEGRAVLPDLDGLEG